MRRVGSVIECTRDHQVAALDREPAARIVEQRERGRSVRIRIGGAERAHHRAGGGILLHARAGERDIGRRLIDVGDVDDERLLAEQSAGVRRAHDQLMRGGRLEIEFATAADAQ